MSFKPDLTIPENREYWDHVKKLSEQVKTWPDWMKGKDVTGSSESQSDRKERKTAAFSTSKKALK
jgi:hypothetical protein